MINSQPQLIKVYTQDSSVKIDLFVPENLGFFEGHFKDFPLLAAVVQLNWAVDFAQKYLDVPPNVGAIEVIKFSRPIFPNTDVELELRFSAEQMLLEFTYKNSAHKFSTGKIRMQRPEDV